MGQPMKGNLLVAHGGGPTAVINASLQGVIEEARRHGDIKRILGARYGVEGILAEDFIDLGRESEGTVSLLSLTPGSALGSCRRKLQETDYPRILDCLRRNGVRYLLYNGGNDSMDTCARIAGIAGLAGADEIRVIGIPKTIDNDLAHTDHCPGFGSAARYVAVATRELAGEAASLPIHVLVLEVMGRNAGWLAAAASLAGEDGRGADLIYLPERPFVEGEFLEDVEALWARKKGVLVVASEGLVDARGRTIADTGMVDGFGHVVPGGVGQSLADRIVTGLKIKSRAEKPGLLGRASAALQSEVDRLEAYQVGVHAVRSAVEGASGSMVSIRRVSDRPYRPALGLVPLEDVANVERKFPVEWINDRGNGVEGRFREYCAPLVGGALPQRAVLAGF